MLGFGRKLVPPTPKSPRTPTLRAPRRSGPSHSASPKSSWHQFFVPDASPERRCQNEVPNVPRFELRAARSPRPTSNRHLPKLIPPNTVVCVAKLAPAMQRCNAFVACRERAPIPDSASLVVEPTARLQAVMFAAAQSTSGTGQSQRCRDLNTWSGCQAKSERGHMGAGPHECGVDSGPIPGRFGADQGSFGADPGSIRGRFGIDSGSVWGRSKVGRSVGHWESTHLFSPAPVSFSPNTLSNIRKPVHHAALAPPRERGAARPSKRHGKGI